MRFHCCLISPPQQAITKNTQTIRKMNEYALYCNENTHYKKRQPEEGVEDFDKISFPYFPSKVNAVKPIGVCSLSSFLKSHKNPKPEIISVFKQIEDAIKNKDERKKTELKQKHLFYFTPSVNLQYRNYDNIDSFNPLMVAEYDKIGESVAKRLKKAIFERFDSCICAYLSPSRNGCKFLFKIPVVHSVEEYKEYFCGLAYYLSQIKGFDGININPTQPLFISMDKNILIRTNPSTWKTRGFKINSFKLFEGEVETIKNVSTKDREEIKRNITKAIKQIEDNAHPKVVATATSFGGFCAAGYFSLEEAENFLHKLIEENEYMKKGTNGYKKTASEMLKRGASSPLYLKKHFSQKEKFVSEYTSNTLRQATERNKNRKK